MRATRATRALGALYLAQPQAALSVPEVAMALNAGSPLDACVDPRDAEDVRLALLSHSQSPMPQNQARFRLNVDGRWIQLITVGDHDERGKLLRIRDAAAGQGAGKCAFAAVKRPGDQDHNSPPHWQAHSAASIHSSVFCKNHPARSPVMPPSCCTATW